MSSWTRPHDSAGQVDRPALESRAPRQGGPSRALLYPMRVLLINSNREQSPWPAAPIGLSMVASAREAAGHEVSFLDLAFAKNPAQQTRKRAAEVSPDVVAISIRNLDNCNFDAPRFYLDEVRDDVVRAAREACPGARIVIGGA